jgi:RNA polymerase sigma-70 factor (ECF subfamily)
MNRSVIMSPAPEEAVSTPQPHTFESLYEDHFDFVFRCLRRLGIAAANAEDACQEVFIVLHRRIGDIRAEASARAFLFGVATRVASEHRRKHARNATLALNEELAVPDTGNDPFVSAAQAQAARQLERFLATLDPDQRVVFMLVELEDFAVPEVCEALGAKLNTVYSRLRLARARFVKFLREEGLSHE